MKKLLTILLGILLLLPPITVAADGPEPLVNDAFVRPGISALWGSNSEYLIGKVSPGIIFIESDGSIDPQTEDWTIAEMNEVLAEITAGLDWWKAREPRANVTWVIEDSLQLTGYEPISRSHLDAYLWIEEMLTAMGYTGLSAFTLTDDYNNDMILRHGTDWAFTIFVVDSSNDADGKFADLRFAWAYLGGPYMVMTYDNDGYGIGGMDMVAAHEVGHIFGALDQSSPGPCCEATSGILEIPNHNSSMCPWPTVPSIMKFPPCAYPFGLVDRYARGQVGWWDANCNGVLDPVDPNVETDYCHRVHLPIIVRMW